MNTSILGSNIQKFRMQQEMTQEAMAEKCGLSTVYYKQIEHGYKVPRLETFLRIAEALQTPTDKLLSGNVSWTENISQYEVYEYLEELPLEKKKAALKMLEQFISVLNEF